MLEKLKVWLAAKFAGKKTFAALALLLAHQAAKFFGFDVAEADLSITIDTILTILAAIFRWVSTHNQTTTQPAQ